MVSDPDETSPRDHLHYERARLRCRVCGAAITVGPDGTEYGHVRHPRHGCCEGRCPHRPESVDPKREHDYRAETVEQGPNGKFRNVEETDTNTEVDAEPEPDPEPA